MAENSVEYLIKILGAEKASEVMKGLQDDMKAAGDKGKQVGEGFAAVGESLDRIASGAVKIAVGVASIEAMNKALSAYVELQQKLRDLEREKAGERQTIEEATLTLARTRGDLSAEGIRRAVEQATDVAAKGGLPGGVAGITQGADILTVLGRTLANVPESERIKIARSLAGTVATIPGGAGAVEPLAQLMAARGVTTEAGAMDMIAQLSAAGGRAPLGAFAGLVQTQGPRLGLPWEQQLATLGQATAAAGYDPGASGRMVMSLSRMMLDPKTRGLLSGFTNQNLMEAQPAQVLQALTGVMQGPQAATLMQGMETGEQAAMMRFFSPQGMAAAGALPGAIGGATGASQRALLGQWALSETFKQRAWETQTAAKESTEMMTPEGRARVRNFAEAERLVRENPDMLFMLDKIPGVREFFIRRIAGGLRGEDQMQPTAGPGGVSGNVAVPGGAGIVAHIATWIAGNVMGPNSATPTTLPANAPGAGVGGGS